MIQEKMSLKLKELKLEPVEQYFGQTTEDMVKSLEQSISTKLPKDYRWFLVTYGASSFVCDVVFPALHPSNISENNAESLDFFLGLTSNFNIKEAVQMTAEYPDVLPIAESPGGNFICIGLAAESYGKVFFLDHESAQGLSLISSSFFNFIISGYEENREVSDEEIKEVKLELDEDLF